MSHFIRIALSSVCFLGALATASSAQTLDEYLRKEGYTPVPQHNSNWVPGGILRVQWRQGTYNYTPPFDDFKNLSVDQGITEQLDFGYQAKAKDAQAAVSGVQSLLNAVGFNITGGKDFTFSGASFNVSALKADTSAMQAILDNHNGSTYKYLAVPPSPNGILKAPYDVFIITQVNYATSASIHSAGSFGVNGSVGTPGGATAPGCKLPTAPQMPNGAQPPASGGTDPAHPTTGAPDPAQASSAMGAQTTTTPGGAKKTTTPPTSQTTTGDAQAKANQLSASPITASLSYAQCSENEGVFTSRTPVPTTLKVVEVYLNLDGNVQVRNYGDNVAVPLDDPSLLKRLRQCSRVGGSPVTGCRKY